MASSPYLLKSFKYSSHYWILRILAREKRPLRILDVGTAAGYLGKALKEKGHFVVGVEKQGLLADEAKPYYDNFFVADIEVFDFPFREEFDYIVFADVLEHLRNPAIVIRRVLPALKGTGNVIVSVPNVANVVVRLSLLVGRFDYAERGILDKDHMRFFTFRSLRKMMRDAGYRVREVVATPLPVQLVFPCTDGVICQPFHEVHYWLVRAWKTLFGYQFVIRVVPVVRGSTYA